MSWNFNVIKDINCKITAKPNEDNNILLNLGTCFWMEHYKKWVWILVLLVRNDSPLSNKCGILSEMMDVNSLLQYSSFLFDRKTDKTATCHIRLSLFTENLLLMLSSAEAIPTRCMCDRCAPKVNISDLQAQAENICIPKKKSWRISVMSVSQRAVGCCED